MSFGVYVHVPFCERRCDYCDFATWTDRSHLVEDYFDACRSDLERHASAGLPSATSVFFGGGTPSLVPAECLVSVLGVVDRTDDAEVTVECNPDAVDPEKLARYRAAGVNRLSFGVQSFAPHVLRALGRTHDPANVASALAIARHAGFERVNVDLIYGTPGESLDDWRRALEATLELGPGHVSAYALTVESGTPLGQRVASGEAAAPDDDDQAEKYAIADECLGVAGLEWYEISNWARPGEECLHNHLYWSQGEYLGIGCAAHGHTGGRRWWNVRTPERYIERVKAGESPEGGSEHLDPDPRAEEAFALALRTRVGAHAAPSAVDEARHLAAAGLLELIGPPTGRSAGDLGEDANATGVRVVLTLAGRLLTTDVTARLLLAGAVRPMPLGTR